MIANQKCLPKPKILIYLKLDEITLKSNSRTGKSGILDHDELDKSAAK